MFITSLKILSGFETWSITILYSAEDKNETTVLNENH
jgi:hypothetical protein